MVAWAFLGFSGSLLGCCQRVDGGFYGVTKAMLVGFKKFWVIAATKYKIFALPDNALATI